jgi:hypothetical protein
MGCNCPDQTPCECAQTPGVNAQEHPVGDLLSGGTGMSMRRFKPDRTQPGGPNDWGSAPGWVGFRRPTQDLNRQWTKVAMPAPQVGFHQHRVYVDPEQGTAVSLMGEPSDDGHYFPTDTPNCGYEFAAGSP